MEFLSHAFAAYRILQDSGLWLWQMHAQQVSEYMQMFMKDKGWAE